MGRRRNRIKSGISLYTHSEIPKKQNKILLLISEIFLLFLSAWMTLRCVLSVTDVEVHIPTLLLGCVISCGIWCVIYLARMKYRLLLVLVYAVAGFLWAWKRITLIGNGMLVLANRITALIANYYGTGFRRFPVRMDEAECVTVFLIFFLQPVMAVFAATFLCGYQSILTLILLVSAAFSGFAVDAMPSERILLLELCCIVAVCVQQWGSVKGKAYTAEERKKIHSDNTRRSVISTCIFAVICALTMLVIQPDFYEEKIRKPERKEAVEQGIDAFVNHPVWEKVGDKLEEWKESIEEKWGSGANGGDKENNNNDKNNQASGNSSFMGGLNSGRFNRSAGISFQNVTALKVTLPQPAGSVYIRGYTGAVYTEDGWEEPASADIQEYDRIVSESGFHSQDREARLLKMLYDGDLRFANVYFWDENDSISQSAMSVDYITANRKYVYAPYGAVTNDAVKYNGDGAYLPKKRQAHYDFDFYAVAPGFYEQLIGKLNLEHISLNHEEYTNDAFEMAYREYVNEVYTRLPDGHEALKKLNLGVDQGACVSDKVKAVKNFLSSYRYTLEPGEMPWDADFVDYFLFENKKGYCVHFASSAVLLLRSLGVPARYAEGYVLPEAEIRSAVTVGETEITVKRDFTANVQTDGYEQERVPLKMVEVRDYLAHAWVEVYFDSVGWVPVEMTVGYGNAGQTQQMPEEINEEIRQLPSPTPLPTNTPVPQPTNTPTPTEAEKPSVTNTPAPTITEKPSLTNTPAPTYAGTTGMPDPEKPIPGELSGDNQTEPGEYTDAGHQELLYFLRCLVIAVALAAVPVLRYRLVKAWQERTRSPREQVVYLYHRVERLLSEEKIYRQADETYAQFAKRVQNESCFAGEDFAKCQELSLRAVFGEEKITKQDAEWMQHYYNTIRRKLLDESKKIRRAFLCYWKVY